MAEVKEENKTVWGKTFQHAGKQILFTLDLVGGSEKHEFIKKLVYRNDETADLLPSLPLQLK